ncbi:MAG: ComEA family DNA-binding protein [Acidimicrobiia bacterium]|nr:ComEA family DNA-binding protein [Acidimicrobiia bacterium]MDX2467489.1 ComEA family DNA-binding protein [Acidimicrobiia bacterium]
MPSRYWVAVAGLIAASVAASLWFGGSSPAPAPLLLDPPADHGQSITVHIAGEVVRPGLVEVSAGSRVADAVAAAGGSTRNADLARVNLAAEVRDGEQIVIAGQSTGAGPGAVTDDGLVRINVASAGELEELPGVGPVLAGRLAAYRDEHGPFGAVEDLLDVPGIGEGKLETLRDSVALP